MKLPKHTNTKIYIISLLIPVVLTAVLTSIQTIALVSSSQKIGAGNHKMTTNEMITAIASGALINFIFWLLIPLMTYAILYLIQIYRMWDTINDGHSRTTPGKAIGFLLIPVFNIFWVFNIWGGFPTDYNAFVNRHQLNGRVPFLNQTLYQFYPVFIFLSGLVVTIPFLLIYFAFVLNSSNKAIDNLKSALAESHLQNYQPQSPNLAFQPRI